MKKYMKLVSLGLTGAMALSLAACGGSGSSAATGETGSDAGSASTAAPGPPGCWGTPTLQPPSRWSAR